MKKNKFNGFYEDEESIQMMNIINEAADKEKERRIAFAKKEKKSTRRFYVGLTICLIFMIGCFSYMAHRLYVTNYDYCVANGHSPEVCEAHLSK